MEEQEQEAAALWLVGLRRYWVEAGAIDRWTESRGVTSLVWTPASYVIDDVAAPIARLTEAGATPDATLLWDLAIQDIRGAADALRWVHREHDATDGFVAVWMDPERLVDPGRAVAGARALVSDVARDNVLPAFAWTGARAGAVTALVADEIPIALSGVRDRGAVQSVEKARERGMERLRKEAEDPEDIEEMPVFLLGSAPDGVDEDSFLIPVSLSTELELLAPGSGHPARVPLSADAERIGLQDAVARLATRAREPVLDHAFAPEPFVRGASIRAGELERSAPIERIWARDHTLWREAPDEISDRLGWLDVAETMRGRLEEIEAFVRRVRAGGVTKVVLCGMGGSSLAPETFRTALGGDLPLTVCDTTSPDAIAELRSSIDIDKTLFICASKSGTTAETRAQLEYFWSLSRRGERFVAITDPGTPLAELARERRFLHVFENPPDIGGRYSALSYFGLVPAAACGVDVRAVLDGAVRMMLANAPSVPGHRSPGARLAVALAEGALGEGRDKLTLVLPTEIAALGPWVEQLIAESTGKDGKGILPVEGEDLGPLDVYGSDRLFVAYAVGDGAFGEVLDTLEEEGCAVTRIRIPGAEALGAEMFRWELATAVLGHLLDVHPFDQPDVESAKERTRKMLEGGELPRPEPGSADDVLADLEPPRYLAIQAFLPPTPEHTARLHAARMHLRDRYRVAVTVGFGPRYLHSTGQLHKGGPDAGIFLQVTGERAQDVDIPGMPYTFGKLFDAQADGDLMALRDSGRSVVRLTLEELEALAERAAAERVEMQRAAAEAAEAEAAAGEQASPDEEPRAESDEE